jgi:ABC-2 type transport system permease protein
MNILAPKGMDATLSRLFFTLFLRGRSLGGIKASVGLTKRFGLILACYFMVGFTALGLMRVGVLATSLVLNSMSFFFTGVFLAGSSGEILFNRDEAEILLHRPVPPGSLLGAKVRVMALLALALMTAFNLPALVGGLFLLPHGVRFLVSHTVSMVLMALFTTGGIVLAYQLCLAWFGRARLEAFMTASQVLAGIAAMFLGQVPRLFSATGFQQALTLDGRNLLLVLFPPTWFAGLDAWAAEPGTHLGWLLTLLAVGGTAVILRLALVRLAGVYQESLLILNERAGNPVQGRSGFVVRLASLPPLSWLLRDPVTREAFLLTLRYAARDRDLKLRLYPGLAPFLLLPFLFIFQGRQGGFHASFSLVMATGFLAVLPLMTQEIVRRSQQWKASDVFRIAPLAGPARAADGVRRAILAMLALPILLVIALLMILVPGGREQWPLLLPGLLALPIAARMPSAGGWPPPLSLPVDVVQSASRGLQAFLAMFLALGLGGAALVARHFGHLGAFLGVEAVVLAVGYAVLRMALNRASWPESDAG